MNAPRWLKFVKDAWAFDAKVQAAAPVAQKPQIIALTAITTPDGSDAATTQTLANANKAKINQIIAALKA